MEAATELVGEPPLLGQPGKVRPGESVGARHVHGEQFAAGPAGRDPGPAAQQRLPLGTPGQCDHDPLPGGPGALDAVVGPVAPHPLVDPVGQPEQRELAQGGEVADPEVVGEGGVDLLGAVHVAVGHPSPQRLGRHVDQLDLLGPADDLVGHRLALDDPRDRLDGIVERLQVLDVDGRDDVDPCVEQLVDVLPPLLVAAPRGVGVGELVHERHRGPAGQHGIEVHLVDRRPPVGHHPPRQDLQAVEQLGRVRSAVRLDEADDDVGAPLEAPVGLVEHRHGLADPGGGPEVDAQPAASHGDIVTDGARRHPRLPGLR